MFIYGMSQSVALTVIVYPVLFIIAHILTRYSHALSDISRKEREAASKFLVKIQETLMNPELVKAFSIEKVMNERANEALNMRAEVEKKATTTLAITNGVAVLGSFVPGFIAAAVGVLFLAKGWITVGFLVSFVQIAITRIGGILNMAADFLTSTRRAEASAARVSDMSSLTYERKNGETSLPEATNKVISFKDVSFSYPNKKKALENISFDINKGETIALVGPSGCGKSTILKLILGFYEAQEGDIYIFERNIKQWNLSALRSVISIVFQDLFLFPVSIRENLMAVKPDASEEELRKAINAAELESFISGLPKNIETIIGERGVNVSGGQRQRLTIARTFIKNSSILLLDEPTSALDSVTEAGLQRSLTRLSEGKTTIIVAHRLKTIRNADRIFVVEKGEIVQIGTHDELIGVEGTYRRLYEKQDEENTGGEEYAS
jgi:ABC-type multidrug transport system fused ATPase/permease subunit